MRDRLKDGPPCCSTLDHIGLRCSGCGAVYSSESGHDCPDPDPTLEEVAAREDAEPGWTPGLPPLNELVVLRLAGHHASGRYKLGRLRPKGYLGLEDSIFFTDHGTIDLDDRAGCAWKSVHTPEAIGITQALDLLENAVRNQGALTDAFAETLRDLRAQVQNGAH